MQIDLHQFAEPSLLHRCLAELALEVYAFAGASVMGQLEDGRYGYRLGSDKDARCFRFRAVLIATVYGLDGDASIQLYRDGHAEVLLRLEVLDEADALASVAGSHP